MINSFIIGSLSKTISDCATYPLSKLFTNKQCYVNNFFQLNYLDLIKTRYESDLYNYRNLPNAVASIVKKDGFFGLYKVSNMVHSTTLTHLEVNFYLN